ncbi:Zinc finger BED domain-containing protein DAYSLEEPER, partial [Bienertia sinuspersici]
MKRGIPQWTSVGVRKIKVMLDNKVESPDEFVRDMVQYMKQRFKMKVIRVTFPQLFASHNVSDNINKVRDVLYQHYSEYVKMHHSSSVEESGECGLVCSYNDDDEESGMQELLDIVRSGEMVEPLKSELDTYLDDGLYNAQESKFDVLAWWKEKYMKYPILSKATHVLAIPITTVASEANFSAGGRVIDPYRASLAPKTVQMLICTGDWCISLHGVKRKKK